MIIYEINRKTEMNLCISICLKEEDLYKLDIYKINLDNVFKSKIKDNANRNY